MTVMKRIIRIIFIIMVGSAFLISCEEKETNFKSMYEEWSPGTDGTYYLQFVNASQSFETGVDEQGGFIDINTTIAVALLGSPQSTDINVTINLDPASTVAESMYSLSASSITIPAGKTSGSFSLTAYTEKMPIDEWLDLIMVIDAGANNAPTGTTLHYKLKRIKFCPWTIDEMVGTYSGSETNAYGINVESGASFEVFKKDDQTIQISGFIQSLWGPTYWGETPTAGNMVEFTYKPNGLLEFENQWALQTDNTWDYYVGPGGGDAKWDGCTETFTIPFYFHWDADYGDNIPFLAIFTKTGKKGGKIIIERPELERTFINVVPMKR